MTTQEIGKELYVSCRPAFPGCIGMYTLCANIEEAHAVAKKWRPAKILEVAHGQRIEDGRVVEEIGE